MESWIALSETVIEEKLYHDWVRNPACGAIASFTGTVRNATQGEKVRALSFESYKSMALKEFQKILAAANEKWPIERVAVVHRLGKLTLEETAVYIAVATPHRKAAFQACEFIIDTLKETVPIWKKEFLESGAVWVSAHP